MLVATVTGEGVNSNSATLVTVWDEGRLAKSELSMLQVPARRSLGLLGTTGGGRCKVKSCFRCIVSFASTSRLRRRAMIGRVGV
jgi:hypothetical protein